MSFDQIARMFKGVKYKNEDEWRMTRLIAWEIRYKDSKNRKRLEEYMRIGEIETPHEPTKEELDEIWRKYGKK